MSPAGSVPTPAPTPEGTPDGTAGLPRRRPRTPLRLAVSALGAAAVTAALTVALPAGPAAAALPPGFRSVGYMPSWSGSVESIQYGKLTHVNYAFILPTRSGGLTAVPDAAKLQRLVTLAHGRGVKVSIAVGGWNNGDDTAFEAMARSASARTAFVNNLVGLVGRYDLDGVDIDWEYPDPGASGNNFTALMTQLSSAMHSRGKLLTAAVISGATGTGAGVQNAVFGVVDWLNIMTYDGGNPHAGYDWTIQNVNSWKSRGLPAAKTVVGVPFYSRPGYLAYNQLVGRDPANANRDCATYNGARQCWNGIPTVTRKTRWAVANAGGVMNWELSQDTAGATSLVSAMFDAAGSARR
jgi:chitinase